MRNNFGILNAVLKGRSSLLQVRFSSFHFAGVWIETGRLTVHFKLVVLKTPESSLTSSSPKKFERQNGIHL